MCPAAGEHDEHVRWWHRAEWSARRAGGGRHPPTCLPVRPGSVSAAAWARLARAGRATRTGGARPLVARPKARCGSPVRMQNLFNLNKPGITGLNKNRFEVHCSCSPALVHVYVTPATVRFKLDAFVDDVFFLSVQQIPEDHVSQQKYKDRYTS